MIYTSYFGKLKSLPENIVPVAICAKCPDWYNGYKYRKLAPTYSTLMQWKQNHNEVYYIEHFNKEILDTLDATKVVEDLGYYILSAFIESDLKDKHVALICYEKPEDFCHRHLVAEWLNLNGYECKEWS